MQKINVANYEIPIRFTASAMADMEEQIGRINEVTDLLKGKKRVRTMFKLICIFADAANCEYELTPEWLEKNMKPAQFMEWYMAVLDAYAEGMSIETVNEGGENEPIDLGLQELKKKKVRD